MTDQAAIRLFRNWGRFTRDHLVNGWYTYTDASTGRTYRHEFGWDDQSMADAMREGKSTGGSELTVKYPEVYRGDNLAIRRALEKIPYHQRLAFKARWVYQLKVKDIARGFEIPREQAFNLLETANDSIWRLIGLDKRTP